MGRLRKWLPAILGALLGVAVTPVFFAISVITTYHIDLGIAELLFPYSVIADPYITFEGIACVLAAAQWPLYGFIIGLAWRVRRALIGCSAVLLTVALLIVHLIAAGVAYYRHSTRPLVVGQSIIERNPQSNNGMHPTRN